MTTFTDEYVRLLIRQYYDKPKATAEIELKASTFESILLWLKSFITEFDLDNADGDRLRIIGAIVGLPNSPLFATDDDWRYFIRAKIIKNTVNGRMISEEKNSIQDAIQTLFDGDAYAVDLMRMNLGLYVESTMDTTRLQLLYDLDLLPRTQGVQWNSFISYTPGATFGFSRNPDALSFASSTDPSYTGGVFARKIVL